jgi:hypothetical protein
MRIGRYTVDTRIFPLAEYGTLSTTEATGDPQLSPSFFCPPRSGPRHENMFCVWIRQQTERLAGKKNGPPGGIFVGGTSTALLSHQQPTSSTEIAFFFNAQVVRHTGDAGTRPKLHRRQSAPVTGPDAFWNASSRHQAAKFRTRRQKFWAKMARGYAIDWTANDTNAI